LRKPGEDGASARIRFEPIGADFFPLRSAEVEWSFGDRTVTDAVNRQQENLDF
jgi:hypothetical protein